MVDARKAMPLQIRLLGPAAIEGPNGVLSGPISQRHRLALLAILCRTPRHTVSRDRLVAFLWPEADRFQSRRLLNAAVYAIRQVLGKEAILTQGETVTLAPDALDADVERFERAIAEQRFHDAVTMYAGTFLEGLVIPDGCELDRWIEDERRTLEAAYRRALDALAEAALEQGRASEAVDWLKKRLTREPTDSRVTLALMRALDRAGERTAAIQLAATHASLLRSDLEAEPDPQIERLAAELRSRPQRPVHAPDRALGVPARAIAAPASAGAAPVYAAAAPVQAVPAPLPDFAETGEPMVSGWISIGPRRQPAGAVSGRGGALTSLAFTITATFVLITFALNASSQDLATDRGWTRVEADAVVFPLRVRASPEFAYLGEVFSEEISARIREHTTLATLEPEILREIMDGPLTPRQEQSLGEQLSKRLYVTGTITQLGDSLVIRITAKSGSLYRGGWVTVPAEHQHPREAADLLVTRMFSPEIADRAALSRLLIPPRP
jgi:DNA-binding SARP family transcriptional activator